MFYLLDVLLSILTIPLSIVISVVNWIFSPFVLF